MKKANPFKVYFIALIITMLMVGVNNNVYAEEMKRAIIPSEGLSGSGSKENPYIITSEEDLFYFKNSVNGGNHYQGKYVKLTSDLHLNNLSDYDMWDETNAPDIVWPGLHGFAGYFDGDGHTIYGIYMSNSDNNTGFFNVFNNKTMVTVVNLNLSNLKIYGTNYVGGIIGNADYVEIRNCKVSGEIKANTYVGGFIGYSGSASHMGTHIYDCESDVRITGGNYVGGITGYTYIGNKSGIGSENVGGRETTIILNCTNNRDIQGNSYVGGIAGYLSRSFNCGGMTFDRNCNKADILGKSSEIGGLVGYLEGSPYSGDQNLSENCNLGKVVRGGSNVGGLFGSLYAYSEHVNVFDSYNVSEVVGTSGYIGGIVGRAHNDRVQVLNSYNIGPVRGYYSYGALVGTGGKIFNCYYLNGSAPNVANSTSVSGTRSLSASQFSEQENFSNLSFPEKWKMYKSYPILSWQEYEGRDGVQQVRALVINGLEETPSAGSSYDTKTFRRLLNELDVPNHGKSDNFLSYFGYDSENETITKKAFEKCIWNGLIDNGDEDLSIIFYSGHTGGLRDSESNEIVDAGFLIGEQYTDYYSYDEFIKYVTNNIQGDILVIVDACFSGYLIEESIENLEEQDKSRIYVLAACDKNEESSSRYDYSIWSHIFGNAESYGLFSRAIEEGLKSENYYLVADSNHNGSVSLEELYSFVEEKVSEYCKKYNAEEMNVQAYIPVDMELFADPHYVDVNSINDISFDYYKDYYQGHKNCRNPRGDAEGEKKTSIEVKWGMDQLKAPSSLYNKDMAKLGIVLSNAAYDKSYISGENDEDKYIEERYIHAFNNIAKYYDLIGLDSSKTRYTLDYDNYQQYVPGDMKEVLRGIQSAYDAAYDEKDGNVVEALFTMKKYLSHPLTYYGYKKMYLGDENYNIFFITIRGSATASDWANDVIDGKDEFKQSADYTKEILLKYMQDVTGKNASEIEQEKNKFFITGHSLGGATANRLSVILSEFADAEDIFTYTFEGPHTCWWNETWTVESNAYNIININDFVPNLPHHPLATQFGTCLFFENNALDPVSFENFSEGCHVECSEPDDVMDKFGKRHGLDLDAIAVLSDYPFDKYWIVSVDKSIIDTTEFISEEISKRAFLLSNKVKTGAINAALNLLTESMRRAFLGSSYVCEVACPVDVGVYYEDNLICESVGDTVTNYDETKATMFLLDDQKYIAFYTEDIKKIKITATDDGVMEYTMCKIDEGDLEVVDYFENIALKKGNKYIVDLDFSMEAEESVSTMYLVDDDSVIGRVQKNGIELPIRSFIYDINGGEGVAPIDNKIYAEGDSVRVMSSDNISKTGYTFDGWSLDRECKGHIYRADDIYKLNNDTVMYAKWIPNKYSLTFDTNGGVGLDKYKAELEVLFGEPYGELPENISRYGYTFDGWYTENGEKVDKETKVVIAKDHTLKARFIKQQRGICVYDIASYEYTGNAIKPLPEVYNGEDKLILNVDYTLRYKNNVKVGNKASKNRKGKSIAPTVIVRGKGNFDKKIVIPIEFEIKPADIRDADVFISDIKYDGRKKMPIPKIVFNDKKLVNNKDFTLTYENSDFTSVGEHTIVIDAKKNSNFTECTKVSFYIYEKNNIPRKRESITKATIPELQVYTYTGSSIMPASNDDFTITQLVSGHEKKLVKDKDYKVTYIGDNKNVGTAKMKITGIGDYTGYIIKPFKIARKQLNNLKNTTDTADGIEIIFPDGAAIYKKSGGVIEPKVLYKINESERQVTLRKGEDYKVKYKNNKKISTRSKPVVTIIGVGNYKGKIEREYEVIKSDISASENRIAIVCPDAYKNSDISHLLKCPILFEKNTGKKLKPGVDYYNGAYDEKRNPKGFMYEVRDKGAWKSITTIQDTGDVFKIGEEIRVTVTGRGNYEGNLSTTYKIIAPSMDISRYKARASVKSEKYYTGDAIELDINDISITNGKQTSTLENETYEILTDTYANNVNAGKAYVYVKGKNSEKGIYGGIVRVEFIIKPQIIQSTN